MIAPPPHTNEHFPSEIIPRVSNIQQSTGREVVQHGHINMIPSKPVFALALKAACIAEKQEIPIVW